MEETQFPSQNQGNAAVPNHNDGAQNSYGAQNPNQGGSNYNEAPTGTSNAGFAPNPYEAGAAYGSPNGMGMPHTPPKKKKKWLYWFIPLIVILILGGGIATWSYINGSQNEEIVYSTLLGGNENIEDYENYLKQFPDGAHAEEVRERLAQLKTMYSDWTSIANSEYASDFERFKEQYPNSQLVKKCELKIDSLDWVKAVKLNTPEAMEEYMEKHPEGRYISEAGIAQSTLATTQVDEADRSGIAEVLTEFYRAFANNDEASLCTYITPTMSQFLSKKNATKADVVALVKSTYSEDIENCSFVLNNDYEITKSVSNNGKVTFKVNFSVDQHIQRSSEGKTFGSYTANATLTGDLKISSLTMKEVSRQNQ